MIYLIGLIVGLIVSFLLASHVIILVLPIYLVIDLLIWLLIKNIITKKPKGEYSFFKNYVSMSIGGLIGLSIAKIGKVFIKSALDNGMIANPDLLFELGIVVLLPVAASLVARIIVASLLNIE